MTRPSFKLDLPDDWNRIRELFENCLALNEADRARYLARETHGNENLNKWVEDLLSAHSDNRIRTEAMGPLVRLIEDTREPVRIGDYFILDPLARGSTAELFLAVSAQSVGSPKMLVGKRIFTKFSNRAEWCARFKREAHLGTILNHPNIVHTIDVIFDQNSLIVILEHVFGKDLNEIKGKLEKEMATLPLAHSLYIVSELLKALDYAHSRKEPHTGRDMAIIHRDLSPKNVMVSYEGQVKILDFGIAKINSEEIRLTQTGAVLGTIYYMSPEQAEGQTLDARSDIFSVGILLFELISGKMLFDGDTPMKALKQARDYETPTSHLQGLRVPNKLKQILVRALAKLPADRYPSAAEFLFDVDEYRNRHFPLAQREIETFISKLFAEEIAEEGKRIEWWKAKLMMPKDEKD